MDFNELKQIIELFSKNNVDRLELSQEGISLKLGKRRGQPAAPVEIRQVHMEQPAAAVETEEADADLIYVTSPIVGTFYRAPNPTAAVFVEVGDRVRSGQTLCIVEAMKLMNEIQADHAGEVVKILVDNGQGVEFGQSLFALKAL